MRKNVLDRFRKTLAGDADIAPVSADTAPTVRRPAGAARAMTDAIDEMAEATRRLYSGAAIVDIEPELIDPSPVADRIEHDPEEFAALLDAIRETGQSQPVLVRPHESNPRRYVTVYGHRRIAVARELGRPVRAIVRDIDQTARLILQGQENAARADLTFIEKALFAKKIVDLGETRQTAMTALAIDDKMLIHMLGVANDIPAPVIDAIGAARGIGRPRWQDLRRMLAQPETKAAALKIVRDKTFLERPAAERFQALIDALSKRGRAGEKAPDWTGPDNAVRARFSRSGKNWNLSVDSESFSRFIVDQLDKLYDDFKSSGVS